MGIVNVRFRTNVEFEDYYYSEPFPGRLFCPTTTEQEVGEPVVVELSAPALPNKVLVRACVQSWRPALPRLRVRAGAMVIFAKDEAEKVDFVVRTIRGELSPPQKRKHSRLPVALPIRYRTDHQSELQNCVLSEISAGGATLLTEVSLPIDTEIILEILPPGAVSPICITGRSTYLMSNGGTGLKFITRDAGGSKRLQELVRRLRVR